MFAKENRQCPFGAESTDAGVSFRVWAPGRGRVEVVLTDERVLELAPEKEGFFVGRWEGLRPGARYRYRLDGGDAYPDPASRFQPEGVHGPSEVVDPTFAWTDGEWPGVMLQGQVIYELHIGAFTAEGTFQAARSKLQHLADTGVTVIEVMPVNEFNGEFGWGYDGVYWYAPSHNYGTPNDLRCFVNEAHAVGLAVILDVVYNHFGPAGNYLDQYSPHFVSERHATEWGGALNFDGEGAEQVRRFVTANAAHWIAEYHLDGLRIDATQVIYDDSPRHVLADLSLAARQAAGGRSIILISENEHQDIHQTLPIDQGGFGLDGVWNDDYHHACRVAATGHAEFYYADYAGTPQELISVNKWGYLFQGQYASAAGRHRGTPAHHAEGWRFIHCLQNHDQVANSAKGLRLWQQTSPGRARALTTLLLLGPGTPMLFMGQEIGANMPFLYFADHHAELAKLVREGRSKFLSQFASIAGDEVVQSELHDPAARATFESTKLAWSETDVDFSILNLHHDLLALRREDRLFAYADRATMHGAVIGPEAFLLRWLSPDGNDRLLIINLGREFHWSSLSEPLMAPPVGCEWRLRFSSNHPRYGGSGVAAISMVNLTIPGHTAVLLTPQLAPAEGGEVSKSAEGVGTGS
jgi:maltooligosyltrehalose trehalohydrolase